MIVNLVFLDSAGMTRKVKLQSLGAERIFYDNDALISTAAKGELYTCYNYIRLGSMITIDSVWLII